MPAPEPPRAGGTDDDVDPSWGPPPEPDSPPGTGFRASGAASRQRPGWLPLLVVSLVTVLVAGALFVADHGGAGRGRTAASAYLPDDGAVSYRMQSTTTGDRVVTGKLVEESSRRSGDLVHNGLDFTLGAKVGGVVGFDRLDQIQLWRTTGTKIGSFGEPQRVRVYQVDQAVTLIADSDAAAADIYTPGLVELPADVAAGADWSSEGTVGARAYRSNFRAEAAEPGCLRVSGTIVESATSGPRRVTERDVTKLWCQGRGVVSEETVQGGTRSTSDEAPSAAPSVGVQTVDENWEWSDPATWRRRDFELRSADPTLGPGQMTGAPGLVPSVVTASGLLIRPTSGDDLVATTPRTIDSWTSLWRMHPGGTVLSVAGFGNVVVVTTSRREAVGYADTGVRLWTVALDDVAFRPAVRVDDGRVAIGDAAGGVRVVDVRTGAEIWQAQISEQLSAPLVADRRVVVAFDQGGTTTAFAADSGEQLWTSAVSGTLGAIFGDLVVVRHEGTLDALDITSGRHRWLLPQTGTLDALQPFGDLLVAATRLDTLAIDRHGVVKDTLPAYAAVTVVGDTMVGWSTSSAEFRDRELSLRKRVDTPKRTLASVAYMAVPYRHGVIVFDIGWAFTTWSSEP